MSRLRRNPLTGRWVVLASGRADRPAAWTAGRPPVEAGTGSCPFCPGNEHETAPAILEIPGDTTTGDRRPGRWRVRVVPNLYPAFGGEGRLEEVERGPVHTEADAVGAHEVLIMTPDHDRHWATLDDDQVGLVMATIGDRVGQHGRHKGIRYSQVIVNHGPEAGASLGHPHAQLLGIPFVPSEVRDELAGFDRHHGRHGECLLCQTVAVERAAQTRVVADDGRAVVVCPYWSGMAFELLVLPVAHEDALTGATPDDLDAVGQALRDALVALDRVVGDVAYNIVFHTAPHPPQGEGPFHWHVHVLPRLTSIAGFEQGTGVLINVVDPEDAADQLRAALPPRRA